VRSKVEIQKITVVLMRVLFLIFSLTSKCIVVKNAESCVFLSSCSCLISHSFRFDSTSALLATSKMETVVVVVGPMNRKSRRACAKN
jgi:hypothetical protein